MSPPPSHLEISVRLRFEEVLPDWEIIAMEELFKILFLNAIMAAGKPVGCQFTILDPLEDGSFADSTVLSNSMWRHKPSLSLLVVIRFTFSSRNFRVAHLGLIEIFCTLLTLSAYWI